jgi:hypothetical protein
MVYIRGRWLFLSDKAVGISPADIRLAGENQGGKHGCGGKSFSTNIVRRVNSRIRHDTSRQWVTETDSAVRHEA